MFDGTLKATFDESSELARLRALYDGLLTDPPTDLSKEAEADLVAMARIFDLDTDRPAGVVWRDLRAVLTRQASPGGGAGDPPPACDPLTIMVVEDVEIEIHDKDIRIDSFRASGSGGQHVNKTDSAVRITHMPSGIVVTSSEKSQHVNRDKAMKNLRVRLYDMQRQEKDLARSSARKSQVGSGDRSERIRTYNFPQGRVTDHRIGLTLHSLPQTLEGDLDPLLNALIAEDQAARLADLEAELG